MKRIRVICILSVLLIGLFSPRLGFTQQAVLIEEGGVKTDKPTNSSIWIKKDKALSESKPLNEVYADQDFSSAQEMKSKRRVGVGLLTAGQVGLFGAILDLNFTPKNSFTAGFGGGPMFNSISFQWKHSFDGRSINPYAAFGLAYWTSHSGNKEPINKTTPSFLGDKYLNENEKKEGKFAKGFLIPSAGIQYNQLFGPYVGASLFAEVLLFLDPADLSPTPTGALGTIYYF